MKIGSCWTRGAVLILGILVMGGTVFAQGGHEGHGGHGGHGEHQADPQMAKLHAMMPEYAGSEAKITAALESGDLKAVLEETDYILSTTGDLKKSKPHKKSRELKAFAGLAAAFESGIRQIAEKARKGDVAGAKASFAEARKKCVACHAKFRD